MKNFRFWFVAKLAVCLLVPGVPAQAETDAALDFEFDTKQELQDVSLPELDNNLEITLPEFATVNELENFSPSHTEIARLDADIAPAHDQNPAQVIVPEKLIQELAALNAEPDFYFPQSPLPSLTAQSARPAPPPPAGNNQQPLFPNPEIIIRQNNAPNPDILTPRVPVAPTRSRAVPPPVGDMAISNINAAYDLIDLGAGGRAIVPRLVLREAPAREVLAVLTRYAGMNLIFTDGKNARGNSEQALPGMPGDAGGEAFTISLDIENESVQDVFNSVLMASGLQASRRGNTIFAGASLLPSARNVITRTIRLNQASAESVASILASQGAEVNILFEGKEEVQLAENAPPRVITQPPELVPLTVNRPSNDSSVLILEGLVVSTDDRLNTVTLVGEPRDVELATSMITQMDARRRQVAVNVKIVDINLNNIQDYNSSFSFGVNDSYFIQDNGTAIMRFGDTAPARVIDINSDPGRASNPPVIINPYGPEGIESNILLDTNNPINFRDPGGEAIPGAFYYPGFPVNQIPAIDSGVVEFGIDAQTGELTYELETPTFFEYPKKFQAQIEANILSGNAKILTDPTLIVQEGEAAQVRLTESVVASVDTQVDPLSGVRTTTPVLDDVGLTLNVIVERIDDNGFITVRVNPIIASPGGTQEFNSGEGSINQITLINQRSLDSGTVRLRDEQTFILSGIISEVNNTVTSKVPVLGDLPVIGALFRSSSDETDRNEVIIMLTPKIIPDSTEVQFGYRYTPDKATADYLRQKGFPVQTQP